MRKDFAAYGMRGVKRGGYQIAELLERLNSVLGVEGLLQCVVIGCGQIGSALLRTYGKQRQGVCVVAAFDINPRKIDPNADIPVLDVHELPSFVERQEIRVAVLCVPEEAAAGIMEQIRRSHVRGVLNFTAAHLRSDAQCLVHNLDIRMEIEKLFCLVEMAARAQTHAAAPLHGEKPG